MTFVEILGLLISMFGIGFFIGRGIKSTRQFLNLI